MAVTLYSKGKGSIKQFVLEAPYSYGSLHRGSISRPNTSRCYGQYSTYLPIKDKKLSTPAPMQVNDLPRVATEVPAISYVSWEDE